jgi:hypothetical protein
VSLATIGTGIMLQAGNGDGTATSATHRLGSGTNGVVTTTVVATGVAGNAYRVVARLAPTVSASLSASINGNLVTVLYGTTAGGTNDPAKNTATLVAAAIGALTGLDAVASGTGAGVVSELVDGEQFSGGSTDLDGETYATVAELVAVKPPGYSRNEVDVTNHNAGIEEKLLGMLRVGQVTGKCNWIPTDPTHDSDSGTLADIRANRKRNWRIAFPPTGTPNWTFPARVQKWDLAEITTDAAVQYDFALTLDGDVVMVNTEA